MKKFFGKIKNWFKNHIPTKRRIIQLYTALLFNANIKGFVNGEIYKGGTKNLCIPGLNCYSCPGAVGACPMGALQNALIDSKTRLPSYIFGIIILFGLLLGRTICGFLCPLGLGQELLYKIKSPKLKKSKATRTLSYLKYVVLVLLVVILPIMFAVPGFCEYICPAGTFEGGVGLLSNENNYGSLGMLGPLFTWKFIVLVAVVVLSVFVFRVFCRFLCPLGALYGFFCRLAMLGIKLDKTKCTDCGLCVSVCKMDIKRVGDHECISCGACISVCPSKAISWKGSNLIIRENETETPDVSEIKPLHSMLKPAVTEQTTATENVEVIEIVDETNQIPNEEVANDDN